MKHRAGLDRTQTLLFPERLEDYIGPENPVRFLDAFVGSLDLHALGFARARCAETGRPPYDPAVLLKLYLYGYLHRVRSSRSAGSRVSAQRGSDLADGQTDAGLQDHRRLPQGQSKPLKAVARQFTLLCRKLELFGGELLAIDGSKFAAVNARDQNFNAAKLQDLIAGPMRGWRNICNNFDSADAAEPGAATLTKSELAAKIAALQEGRTGTRNCWGNWMPTRKQVSVTDPDTRKMPTAHGTVVGYNAQLAVDARHKLIAADDVTNEVNDLNQLADVALEAKANLELTRTEVVADAGY
jgi:transposase